MALKITADCSNCHICVPECPNEAISIGPEVYVIDTKLCTECVGFFDTPQCAAVCPVDTCVSDEENVETEEALIQKVKAIHPEKSFSGEIISRYKVKK